MDENLHSRFEDLKYNLCTSLNYYGALWTRSRYWLWGSRAIDFVAVALAGVAIKKDQGWTSCIALIIAAVSWLKTESFIDRRVVVLSKQYLQTNRLLSRIPETPEEESQKLYAELRTRFAEIEEGDLPTIQCLYAVCENEMRKKYRLKGLWKLSWWQSHVGIYFRGVRCDGLLKIESEIED